MEITIYEFLQGAFEGAFYNLQIYDFSKEKTIFDSMKHSIEELPKELENSEVISWEVGENTTIILNIDSNNNN